MRTHHVFSSSIRHWGIAAGILALTIGSGIFPSFIGKSLAGDPINFDSSSPNLVVATNTSTPSLYEFTMDDIDGNPRPLNDFKGQVMMIVNTASLCGNTPQYAGLQALYERYRDQGFTILAFPANDFGEQEPGTNKEIAEFCYTKYSLAFPLFSKITVLGDEKTW